MERWQRGSDWTGRAEDVPSIPTCQRRCYQEASQSTPRSTGKATELRRAPWKAGWGTWAQVCASPPSRPGRKSCARSAEIWLERLDSKAKDGDSNKAEDENREWHSDGPAAQLHRRFPASQAGDWRVLLKRNGSGGTREKIETYGISHLKSWLAAYNPPLTTIRFTHRASNQCWESWS